MLEHDLIIIIFFFFCSVRLVSIWGRLTAVFVFVYVSAEVSERVPNLAKVLASTCEIPLV